jgi:c-di-GMP-binding flagellar brake protein YcgR
MSSDTTEERRKFHRILFDAPTTVSCASGKTYQTTLIDISLNGALITRPENWEGCPGDEEEEIHITLNLENRTEIRMEAMLVHVEQEVLGLQCKHIDMDSITHLRRLVELNMGDAELLERELAALG